MYLQGHMTRIFNYYDYFASHGHLFDLHDVTLKCALSCSVSPRPPSGSVYPRALMQPDLNLNRKDDIWSSNDEQCLLLHRGVRQLLPVDDQVSVVRGLQREAAVTDPAAVALLLVLLQDVPQVLFALCKRQLEKRREVRGFV